VTETILKLQNITKDFLQADRKISAIKDLTLEIKKGEFTSLIGPSGSGKTTLLQIAGLLDTPSSGQVFIRDIDASKADDNLRTEIRKNHIGFVYQFHHLLPEFSALENVALPLLIQGKNKKEALATAEKILAEVDLSDRINHKPAELSGGQQQRVAIARAIVTKPSLILADEPTGNLDSELSEKIFTLLKNLVKSHGIACLVVTHNLELAKKTDRVFSIKDGTLA
jgi:lipoprotein-releasing system ATP-binding protein